MGPRGLFKGTIDTTFADLPGGVFCVRCMGLAGVVVSCQAHQAMAHAWNVVGMDVRRILVG